MDRATSAGSHSQRKVLGVDDWGRPLVLVRGVGVADLWMCGITKTRGVSTRSRSVQQPGTYRDGGARPLAEVGAPALEDLADGIRDPCL